MKPDPSSPWLGPLEELLLDSRTRSLTANERTHLNAILRTHAAARVHAVHFLLDDAAIADILRDAKIEALLDGEVQGLVAIYETPDASCHRHGWLRWRSLAVAAAIVLAGIAGWWQWQASPSDSLSTLNSQLSTPLGSATLSFAAGSRGAGEAILITRAGRTWSPADPLSIGTGDTIELAAGAKSVELRLDDAKTTLALQPGAKFRIVSLVPQKRFALDRGTLSADVAHQPEGKPMLIQTPTAEALVLGTVFTLAAGNDQTGLTVERGVVRLSQEDGSVEDIKAGQSATAALGYPVVLIETAAKVKPAAMRPMQAWIKATVEWSDAGTAAFDFADDRQKWVLCLGATLEADGALRLACAKGGSHYKAVGPQVPVRPGEKLTLTGLATSRNHAQLRVNYYQRDSEPRCFGFNRVPGAFSTGDDADFQPFEFEFEVLDSAEMRFIAPILYLYHADGTAPQEGDAIVLKNLILKRR